MLWEKVGLVHLNPKFGGKNRTVDVAWKTIYNHMSRNKAFQDESIDV